MRRATDTGLDRYIDGWHDGVAHAYCEMVKRGVRLAGWMDAPNRHVARLRALVKLDGCHARVTRRQRGRAGLWIYRDASAVRLIRELDRPKPPSALTVWAMGKLFGYGDKDVLRFINQHHQRLGKKRA